MRNYVYAPGFLHRRKFHFHVVVVVVGKNSVRQSTLLMTQQQALELQI